MIYIYRNLLLIQNCKTLLCLIEQKENSKPGRPSLHSRYPNLVSCIRSFIEQNTAEAHLRRRTSIMYTNGVTLAEIARHVKNELGISISRHTVHRLMYPPRRKSISSKLYKGLIKARVPPKRNTKEKKVHEDFHYSCAQVNLLNEMAYLFKENTLSLSVDNKNKVEVGIPATSRRTKIRTFHLVDQAPVYNDHDFPNANSKLVPAGYQILREPMRSRSLSPTKHTKIPRKRSLSEGSCFADLKKISFCKDKLCRDKIKWPRSGPLHVQLYPPRAIESTNIMHVNHLIKLIKEERIFKEVVNVVAIADGGPDWSVKGVINFMSLGFLWKNLHLDVLIIQCYAPGHSRFNPIERSWSYLTNRIATVTLPDSIDGVTPAPNDSQGWMDVLDNATDLCARFWDGKFYSGFPISVETFKSHNPLIAHIKNAHSFLKDFSNASQKKLRESDEYDQMRNVYTSFVRHGNRKAYQLEFIRCEDEKCSHCSALPKRENPFLNILRDFGSTCPSPELDNLYKGHFKTFLDMFRTRTSKKKTVNNHSKFGSCKRGCSYVFFSKEDEKRHMRLMKH